MNKSLVLYKYVREYLWQTRDPRDYQGPNKVNYINLY